MSNPPKSPPRRQPRRWLPYAGAVLLLAALAVGFWPQPLPVETAPVSTGKLRATISEEGKTRIKQRYVVSAPVTGQLRRLDYKAGLEVKAGETILAVIDPVTPTLLDARTRMEATARRDTAAANLERAKAAYRFASAEFQRFEKLHEQKTVSVQEFEGAQWREAAANRELTAAESSLRQAEAELGIFTPSKAGNTNVLDPVELKSPINGRVLRVFEENARVVTMGTPIAEVGDVADLEVVVEVLSRDGAAIPPGAKVEFEQWGGREPLVGKVRLIEPAAFTKVSALGVEEQRVNAVADLLTPPDQRTNVGDAFRVEARIVVWEADNVLKVPAGALFRSGENWGAFVVTDGHAHLRPVKAGRTSGTETQVLEGLKSGEEVILYPGSRVKDGQRVKTVKL